MFTSPDDLGHDGPESEIALVHVILLETVAELTRLQRAQIRYVLATGGLTLVAVGTSVPQNGTDYVFLAVEVQDGVPDTRVAECVKHISKIGLRRCCHSRRTAPVRSGEEQNVALWALPDPVRKDLAGEPETAGFCAVASQDLLPEQRRVIGDDGGSVPLMVIARDRFMGLLRSHSATLADGRPLAWGPPLV